MLDDLEEIICFATVCDEGSITAAGQALGRSKAHVSRKISSLEQRIGTRLLHRTTRKLTPTDVGLKFKEEALQLYRNSQLVNHRAYTLSDELSGTFVITAPVSIATYLLAPIIPELQKKFPDISFEIHPTNENLDLLAEGIDLAIRSGSVVNESLIAHQIGIAQDVFFAPEQVLGQVKTEGKITDLLHQHLLLNPYSMQGDSIVLSTQSDNIELRPKQVTRISEYPLLLDLVGRGMGIGFAPNYCISELKKKPGVNHILKQWKGREWPILIIYPFQSPVPVKLTKISQYLRQKLGSLLRDQT